MKKHTLGIYLLVILMIFGIGSLSFADPSINQKTTDRTRFQSVNLDKIITATRNPVDKRKIILRPTRPVIFSSKVKRLPEKRKIEYIYTALMVGGGLDPMPEVSYRMFIESRGGSIIPVYVEDRIAKKIRRKLKEEQSARFYAYHVYNYSKGPAFLVVGYEGEDGR